MMIDTMIRPLLVTMTLGFVSLGLQACDKEEQGSAETLAAEVPKASAGATTPPAEKAPTPAANDTAKPAEKAPLPETKLEMVSAGAEPRTKLRYQFKQGSTHKMNMDMQMGMKLTMNGNVAPAVVMPVIRTRVMLTEEKVLENGNVRSEAIVESMTILDEDKVEPQILASLKPELDRVKDLEGWSEMSPRGFIIAGEYKVPPGASPQLRQMIAQLQGNMKQLSFPLPEEAVGAGAKWKVKQVIDNSGMTIDQVSDCTLASVKGTNASLSCLLAQDAKVQTLSEGLPPGTVGKLLSHRATGKTDVDLELTQLVPNSKGKIEAKTKMSMTASGQSMMMETEMTMDMKVTRLK